MSLTKMIKLCLDAAIEIADMDSGGIYLVNEFTGEATIEHYRGLTDSFINEGKYYANDSVNAVMIQKGDPMYLFGNDLGQVLSDLQRKEGLKSLAVIPVINENRAIACLNIASHVNNTMDASVEDALETLIAQIGSIIGKAKTERALRDSEQKFSKAFQSNSVLMAISDVENRSVL